MSISAAPRLEAAEVPAFKLFRADVSRVARLGANLVRITFVGAELAGMTSGGLDQRIKILLPRSGQREPSLPEWERSFQGVRGLPEELRPHMRTYTMREHRPELGEFDVDFVLHGDTGPGSRFAAQACPGDRVGVIAPNSEFAHGQRFGGVEYKMDRLDQRTLIVGDATALPAIGSILAALPNHVRAEVYVEVSDSRDVTVLPSSARANLRCFTRDPDTPGGTLLTALRSAPLPGKGWYAWVAGEAGMVKSVRRHLVSERGWDRETVTFMGYWRCGRSEDA